MKGNTALSSLGASLLRWTLGMVLVVTTFRLAWEGLSISALVICGIASALTLPPSWRWLTGRFPWTPSGNVLVVIVTVLLIALMVVGGNAVGDRQAVREAKEQQESQNRIAAAKQARLEEFEQNKTAILSNIESQLQAGDVASASAATMKFLSVSKDPDLQRLHRKAAALNAKAELAKEDSLSPEKRLALYKALQEDAPDNAEYARKVAALGKEVEEEQALERARQLAQAKVSQRSAAVKAQFSGWDGSHIKLSRVLKQGLKNPDSYEHVETRFIDTGDSITVYTTIRGTNSFGAVVPSTYVAQVDIEGNVLSVKAAK